MKAISFDYSNKSSQGENQIWRTEKGASFQVMIGLGFKIFGIAVRLKHIFNFFFFEDWIQLVFTLMIRSFSGACGNSHFRNPFCQLKREGNRPLVPYQLEELWTNKLTMIFTELTWKKTLPCYHRLSLSTQILHSAYANGCCLSLQFVLGHFVDL